MENTNPITNETPSAPFYNVMPRGENIAPLLASTEEMPLGESLVRPKSKKKLSIILAVIVLILLLISGFFLYQKLSDKTETPQVNNEPTLQQPEGVTTSSEWQVQYFGIEVCESVSICGDEADPDRDGLFNLQEFNEQTDPNNPDSDGDGLADGDEVNIFGSNPLKQRTGDNEQYTDSDDAKGGYNSNTGKLFSDQELIDIKEKIKELGLHQPTVQTLGDIATIKYNFGSSTQAEAEFPVLPASFDPSADAQLGRDTERSNTIKKIGSALIQYKASKSSFPKVTSFDEMVKLIKPYNLVATNYNDPVNQNGFVYGYEALSDGQDFALTYVSETQRLIIRYKASNAASDSSKEVSNLNNQKRLQDMESIRTALLVYSAAVVTDDTSYIFPTKASYKTELVPNYISSIPKDPKTSKDYTYTVSANRDSFTLAGNIDSPTTGQKGIICTEEQECHIY